MKKRLLGIVFLILLTGAVLIFSSQLHPEEQPTTTLRIVLWDYDVVGYDRKIVEEFEREHPEITVDVISYPAMYYNSSLKALLDSDERIDVIYFNQLDQFAQIAAKDIMLPLDSMVEKDQMDLSVYPYMDALRDHGELLALPYRKDKFLLYYNRDLFEQVQAEAPTEITWNGFAQLAQKLTERTEDGVYGAYFQLNTRRLPQLMKDGRWDWSTLTPDVIERELEFFRQMEQGKSIPPFSECESLSASQRSFQTGKYAMFVHGTWYLNYLKSDQENGMFDFIWGAAAKPVWSAEDRDEPTQITPICIHKNTEEPEVTWEFLEFVCGKKGAEILADELILPAYEDADIKQKLCSNLRRQHIDPDLVLNGFGEPQKPTETDQRALEEAAEQIYGEALIGLCTPEEAAVRITSLYTGKVG